MQAAPRLVGNLRVGERGFEGKFLTCPRRLVRVVEHACEHGFEFGEVLDVERGVVEPRFRKWALGPVGARMLLGKPNIEQFFRKSPETHLGKSEEARSYLGVEKRDRFKPEHGE